VTNDIPMQSTFFERIKILSNFKDKHHAGVYYEVASDSHLISDRIIPKMHQASILRRTKYHACVCVRGLSPPSVPLFRLPSLHGAAGILYEGRTKRARESESPLVVGEKIGAREQGGRNFASVRVSVGMRVEQRERENEKREERRGEGKGAAISIATRRGGNATDGNHGSRGFLSRADLSVPLSGLSRSPRSPRSPRSSHLDLFLLPTEWVSGRADAAPLSSRSVKKRWGGLGLDRSAPLRRKGFSFSSFVSTFVSRSLPWILFSVCSGASS